MNERLDRRFKRHFKIVKIDETRHWREDIAAHGPIYGVYLYDEREHTYLCEMTPSYHLNFLYHTFGEQEVPEEIVELVEGVYSDDIYVHVHQIPPTAYDCGKYKIEKDQTYEDVLEGVLEYYRCNWVV